SRGGVYYAVLMQSQRLSSRFPRLTPRWLIAVAVSVDAHYREFFWPDKTNFQKKAQLLTF
ncbi:hypothetical protein MRO71_19715, partial [Dickeya dianthicola]|uniref:hypothetical protein n=1 Tax=Dickeya dianthicola TaxID=204039 RepID=UPI001FA7B477